MTPTLRMHPDSLKLHSRLRLHSARPWAIFRDGTSFYLADYAGPPFVFSNYRSVSLSGDDLHILLTGDYFRCENGIVYHGIISTLEVTSGEVTCTGLPGNNVRSLDAWKNSDNTYGMVYSYDTDPDDDGVQGFIMQSSSVDGTAWTSNTNIMTTQKCDFQELVYEANLDMNHGFFEKTDTYALEKLSVAIISGGNSYNLRLFRIGRKNRFDAGGAFSSYEGWTALGRGLANSIAFIEEADFTITGQILTDGDIQILQIVRV